MEGFYPYILIIHLLCAIFFIGYLFVDILILNILKKTNPSFNKEIFESIGVKIMPFIVILLFLSGGALAGFHFKPLNLLFGIKIIFAFGILSLVGFYLFCYFILKKTNPLKNFIHPFCLYTLYFYSNFSKINELFFLYLIKNYSTFKMGSI